MKKILIPTDGSEYAGKAIEKAAEIAEAFDSEVELLYVSDIRSTLMIVPEFQMYAGLDDEKLDVEIDKKASQVLEEGKKKLGREKVTTNILEGYPADEIIHYVQENDFDLLVMGSHGIGSGIKRYLLGSVTNQVIQHVNIPTLIIR